MKSFEDIVSQYAEDIPEGTNQTLTFTSLTLVSEKVRFCVTIVVKYSLTFNYVCLLHKVNLDNLKTKGRRFSAG